MEVFGLIEAIKLQLQPFNVSSLVHQMLRQSCEWNLVKKKVTSSCFLESLAGQALLNSYPLFTRSRSSLFVLLPAFHSSLTLQMSH